MIVMKNKAEIQSMDDFHNYLYEMSEENYELLKIYENLDEDFQKIQDDRYEAVEDREFYIDYNKKVSKGISKLINEVSDGKYLGDSKGLILKLEELL